MEKTRTRGRQSDTMIDWMKSNDVEYDHIKKRAHDREDWRHWRPGPAWKGIAHKKSTQEEDHLCHRVTELAPLHILVWCCVCFSCILLVTASTALAIVPVKCATHGATPHLSLNEHHHYIPSYLLLVACLCAAAGRLYPGTYTVDHYCYALPHGHSVSLVFTRFT